MCLNLGPKLHCRNIVGSVFLAAHHHLSYTSAYRKGRDRKALFYFQCIQYKILMFSTALQPSSGLEKRWTRDSSIARRDVTRYMDATMRVRSFYP